jgi:DNA-directed RNA polymerase specialized sigma24 family protein
MSEEENRTGRPPQDAEPGSVTRWLSGLRAGRTEAIQALWERYCGPCRDLARHRLGEAARVVAEDDVFADAFQIFCAAARNGRFPNLTGRENVIRLLARITLRKACEVRRREGNRRDKVRGESALGAAGFEPFAGRDPPPEFEAEVNQLLDVLGTDELRDIALMRMYGYSYEEIATEQNCSIATIARRVAIIRSRWATRAETGEEPGTGGART